MLIETVLYCLKPNYLNALTPHRSVCLEPKKVNLFTEFFIVILNLNNFTYLTLRRDMSGMWSLLAYNYLLDKKSKLYFKQTSQIIPAVTMIISVLTLKIHHK